MGMIREFLKLGSWVGGVCTVIAIAYFYGFSDLLQSLLTIPLPVVVAWVGVTLFMRVLLTEALVLPLGALGSPLRRLDVFCMGWIRTFFNQIIPMTGMIYLAGFIRSRSAMAWSRIAALGSPLFLVASQATAIVGIIGVALNAAALGSLAAPVGMIFVLVAAIATVLNSSALYRSHLFPRALPHAIEGGSEALDALKRQPLLALQIFLFHVLVLLLRGFRLWILFLAFSIDVSYQSILLLTALGSIALLVQITPGGIGVQEGILIATSYLMGIDPEIMAGIALIDRLLTVLLVVILTVPSAWYLHGRNRAAVV